MGLLDQFRKNKEEQKQKEHPTTPPPIGHTLAEIMQDKKKFDLFGRLLEREGNKDLAGRLFMGKLVEGDIDLLEEQRKIFSEKITKAEKIEKLMTTESIIDLARSNLDFEKVVNQLGPEKVIKVITSQLKEISITDEDRFNTITSLLEAKESYRNGEYKEINEKVEKLLKDKNITQKEYLDALAIEDPDEKAEALKQLSYRTNLGLKRAVNFLSGGRFAKDTTLDELNESQTSSEDAIKQLNIQNESIGRVLFMSVNENKDMRSALASELINERDPSEPKKGFKELKKETFIESEFDENWENDKRATDYGNQPEDAKERIKNEFIERAKNHYREKNEGKGVWHSIVMAFTKAFINSKKAKLK